MLYCFAGLGTNQVLIDGLDNNPQTQACNGTDENYRGFFACPIDDDGDGIAITAQLFFASNIDIANSYDLRANGFINKPVDFDRFFDIIQHIERFWLKTVILPNMF